MQNVVLFVDDEENILNSIKRAVLTEDFTTAEGEEFTALFARNGMEALNIMKNQEISVLVTDMMMPEMDGLTLLKKVKLLYPMTTRVILSGHTQLSHVLAAINQGDIFRFITKPWSMEADLFSVVHQGIEYYNLRRDKQELEKSLQQKNAAYKNMLRTLEAKFSSKQADVGYLKNFLMILITGLEQELKDKDGVGTFNGLLKLQLVREMVTDYFQTLPVVIEEFMVQDIVEQLNQHLTQHNTKQRYHIKVDNGALKCCGNLRILMMILRTMSKIVCRLGSSQTFKHGITSQVYLDKGMVRINNVIEFGYVEGAKVVIDAEELLSHANLEFYSGLLAQIGQPYEFDIAYTYVNQNISLIGISAKFTLV